MYIQKFWTLGFTSHSRISGHSGLNSVAKVVFSGEIHHAFTPIFGWKIVDI